MYIDHHGKNWYKGNLHTHTVKSDGGFTAEQVISRYRDAGYDFLAITDHSLISETTENPGFLTLSGCEFGTSYKIEKYGSSRIVCIEINGVGFVGQPDIDKNNTTQEIVDAIHKKDGIAIFNHPEWTRNLPEDLLAAEIYDGVEIYNAACGETGYAKTIVDQTARYGRIIPAMASDDTHRFQGEEFRGFIMVQAENLSRTSILRSIREKRFFASQGPWIQSRTEGNKIYIECTPVSSICVFTNMIGNLRHSGKGITSAEFTLYSDPRLTNNNKPVYYLVEAIDENGKMAWLGPVGINAES